MATQKITVDLVLVDENGNDLPNTLTAGSPSRTRIRVHNDWNRSLQYKVWCEPSASDVHFVNAHPEHKGKIGIGIGAELMLNPAADADHLESLVFDGDARVDPKVVSISVESLHRVGTSGPFIPQEQPPFQVECQNIGNSAA